MAQEYKLKGLSSLNIKNGEMQEVEVEGIEKGKVLLVNQDGKTHAMSSNCTHYGAPLKNGVLSPDGTITCAWHGGVLFCSLDFSSSSNMLHESVLQDINWRR